jgi:hypothetical protein
VKCNIQLGGENGKCGGYGKGTFVLKTIAFCEKLDHIGKFLEICISLTHWPGTPLT